MASAGDGRTAEKTGPPKQSSSLSLRRGWNLLWCWVSRRCPLWLLFPGTHLGWHDAKVVLALCQGSRKLCDQLSMVITVRGPPGMQHGTDDLTHLVCQLSVSSILHLLWVASRQEIWTDPRFWRNEWEESIWLFHSQRCNRRKPRRERDRRWRQSLLSSFGTACVVSRPNYLLHAIIPQINMIRLYLSIVQEQCHISCVCVGYGHSTFCCVFGYGYGHVGLVPSSKIPLENICLRHYINTAKLLPMPQYLFFAWILPMVCFHPHFVPTSSPENILLPSFLSASLQQPFIY